MKIKLIVRSGGVNLPSYQPLHRASNELKELGYEFDDNNYDILMINHARIYKDVIYYRFLKQNNLDDSTPMIVLDARPSSGRLTHWHLKDIDRIIGYIKPSLLIDRDLYRFKYPLSCYHYHLLNSSLWGIDKPLKAINKFTREGMERLHLGWNLGLGSQFMYQEPNFDSSKPVDIHFSVGLNPWYEQDDHYKIYRSQFGWEICKLADKHGFTTSGICYEEEYHEAMRQSKICISPYGDGEICWRDFEAIISGAILVKNDMSHLETWPDVYKPMETYIPVKLDFSDLEEVICGVINNYSKYKYITRNAYKVLKESFDNEVFARRFDGIIKKILNGREN